MRTAHEGLATRVPFQMPLEILWRLLDDLVLVDDAEIEEAIRWYAREAPARGRGRGGGAPGGGGASGFASGGEAGRGRPQRRQPSPGLLCRRARRRRTRMNDSFQPLDLSGLCNAGTRNVDLGGGRWMWPRGDDPHATPLDGLPSGECLFLGVPFHLAGADAERRFVVAAAGESNRVAGGHPRGRHGAPTALRPRLRSGGRGVGHPRRGGGETSASYLVRFADGSETAQPLRRRWEIHDLNAPLGTPSLPLPQLPPLRFHQPARAGRRLRRRPGRRVLALRLRRRPSRRRPGRHGRRPDGLVALRLGRGPPGGGDRRGRPRGGDGDTHRPRSRHPVRRGGRPLPLGDAAHRGGDGGGRRGSP